MLEDIKTLLNITNTTKDKLLNLLIKQQTNFVLDYTNNTILNINLENIVVQLVVIAYNKIGMEGMSSTKFGDISYSFENEIPNPILLQLNKYRRIKTL